jgi:hypothetical protein
VFDSLDVAYEWDFGVCVCVYVCVCVCVWCVSECARVCWNMMI